MNEKAGRILIIDDEPGLRLTLRDFFEDRGFEIFEAENGQDGIEKFREILPDIALIDLKMPGLSGIDVIKTLKEGFPETPLVVISGTGIVENAIEAMRNGAWDYISKPVLDMAELDHILQRVFEKAYLLKENKKYQTQLEELVRERTIELKTANNELSSINERLHSVVETMCDLQGYDRLERFGKFLLERSAHHIKATGGSFFLSKREGLKRIHTLDREPVAEFISYPLKEDSVLLKAIETGTPQLHKDTESKDFVLRNGLKIHEYGSYIVFPLTDNHKKNVGVLTFHKKEKPGFTEQDKEIGAILSSFSSEAVRAINFIEDIKKREQYFKILAKGIGGLSDMEFFQSIVRSCVSIFETEYALLGRIEGNMLNSVAYIENGKYSSVSLDIEKGFSSKVLKEGSYRYSAGSGDSEEDDILKELGIKSYLGVAINDSKGNPIGLLSTFSRYQISCPEYWKEIMELMASKYSSVVDLINADNEQEKLRENLQRAQKMEAIGTLAGGIAHDFNNILSPILGYSEMLLYTIEESSVRKDIEQIKEAGIRAKELVQQILSFSRQKEIKSKPVVVQYLVKEVVRMMISTLPATIKIEQYIDEECPPVHADPTQIHQVIMNLCTNAFHAMEEKGGILTVSTENVEIFDSNEGYRKYVKVVVKDTGTGMEPEILDRIFDPYFTTKKEGKGTGLGLSVAHGIITSCGGFIDLNSRKDLGTTFSVFLPVVESYQSEVVKKEERSIERGFERIMIIDDQVPILRVLDNALGGLGYRITTFEDPLKAVERFRSTPDDFDMIITDQTMPNLTGDKLAKEVFGIKKDIPVVLCTGYSSVITKEKAFEIGIKAYMSKPIEINELTSTIRSIFDG